MNSRQNIHPDEITVPRLRHGHCAACNTPATFTFAGEQRCPERVARLTGLPPLLHLWTCNTCHTTQAEAPVDS